MKHLLATLQRAWYFWRWGEIQREVIERVEGYVAEERILDSKGNEIGYWAYGCYHPDYPFKGYMEGDAHEKSV